MIINRLSHSSKKRIVRGDILIYASLLSGIGVTSSVNNLYAADWVIEPNIGIQQIYSDNANLSHDNEKSDSITVVKPSLSILKEGSRASLDFNYAPEYRRYREETGDNETVHFMRTEGNVEIAKNHLFLDGWLRGDRTNISSSGRSGINGLTGTEDDTDFYSVGLSPYFTGKLGDFSVIELRITADKVDYSEDLNNDSKGKRGEIVFGNGSMFTNQVWEVLFQHNSVDYESLDEDNEAKKFRAELIQKLTTQWSVAFSAGYEDYSLVVSEDRDDTTWSVGAIYTPSPRTRIALGIGERSFGDDYYFNIRHRTTRTVWTASYQQDFTTARDELDSRSLFERQNAFGELVRNPILESTSTVVRSSYDPSISEDFYETKKFSTQFTYRSVRNSVRLRGSYLERNYDNSERDTEDVNLSVLLSRRLSQLTNGYLLVSSADHEQAVLDYDQWGATLGVNYQFETDSRIGFSLSHLERESDRETNSYEENHAGIDVTVAF
jgi:uncharacterized protein (PEP-CTERM system associated)